MPRKYWMSVIVVFVVGLVLNFLMYGVAMAGALRADRLAEVPAVAEVLAIVAEAVFVLGFVWLWSHGMEAGKAALGQGLRYGLAVALVTFVPGALLVGAIVPEIGQGVLVWAAVVGSTKMVIMGAVVSQIMRPTAP